uniref:Uncharacterized protein n=1 Tax=Romanomermis culicivorax TaxID=13658 RepID=A0A915HT51_ROMCU
MKTYIKTQLDLLLSFSIERVLTSLLAISLLELSSKFSPNKALGGETPTTESFFTNSMKSVETDGNFDTINVS